jgi:hypothetical protein
MVGGKVGLVLVTGALVIGDGSSSTCELRFSDYMSCFRDCQ